jgi:hypothetical protein
MSVCRPTGLSEQAGAAGGAAGPLCLHESEAYKLKEWQYVDEEREEKRKKKSVGQILEGGRRQMYERDQKGSKGTKKKHPEKSVLGRGE